VLPRRRRRAEGFLLAWQAKVRGLQRLLSELMSSKWPRRPSDAKGRTPTEEDFAARIAETERNLAALMEEKPDPLAEPKLFYSDVTIEGFLRTWNRTCRSRLSGKMKVAPSSAALALERTADVLACWNQQVLGRPRAKPNRASVDNRTSRNKRVMVNLMMQPAC